MYATIRILLILVYVFRISPEKNCFNDNRDNNSILSDDTEKNKVPPKHKRQG